MKTARLYLSIAPLAALLLSPSPSVAEEDGFSGFLQRIQSQDDAVRLAARLEAPKWGPSAVAPLGRLLDSENREARITAGHALRCITHHAARPGAEAERAPVAGELVKLLAAGGGDYARREVLFLLGLIGGDDQVEAVAARLDDPGLQVAETARLALERMPAKAATKALMRAIRRAGDEKKPPLIFSLGKKEDPQAAPFLLEWTASSSAEVRLAAFTALAHAGAASAEEPLRKALERKDDPDRTKLFGEYLRLADNLLERGEDALAREMHLRVVRSAPADFQRERSLLRLCRGGDAGAVSTLLIGLEDPEPRVQRAALRILETLDGAAVSKALLEGYEEAKDASRPVILRAIARQSPDAVGPLIERALASASIELKITALDLAGRLDDPEMADAYLAAAREGSSFIRPTAVKGCLSLAAKALESGRKSRAGELYSAALEVATEVEQRQQALAGIVAVGDAQQIDKVASLLSDSALASSAAQGVIAMAAGIAAAGDEDRAETYLTQITGGRFHRDLVFAAAEELRKIGRDPQKAARQKGFVLTWWLIGPIPDDDGKGLAEKLLPEERIRLDQVEEIKGRKCRWQELRDLCPDGMVNLVGLFRRSEHCIAYAYTTITMEEEKEVLFKMGSDDGMACFLGGERVHLAPAPRGFTVDQDTVKVSLKKGENKILMKIQQGVGDWAFSLRITRPDGTPLDLSE